MDSLLILKSSWGIAIHYEVEELTLFDPDDSDTYLIEGALFVKVNKVRLGDNAFSFLKKGIQHMIPHMENKKVCFHMKQLLFSSCDIQPVHVYQMVL